jgi:hypothetical protein
MGIKDEYEYATMTNFVSGKWTYLQIGFEGILAFIPAFILAFLGLWSLKFIFNIAYTYIKPLVLRIKNLRIVNKT